MQLDKSMIHPELRRTGSLTKIFMPKHSERSMRAMSVLIKVMKGRCRAQLNYEQVYVTRPDGSKLRLCVYTPLAKTADVPGILWIHGGGYGLGTPEQDESFIKRFVEASGAVVVSPDYRLSIEAPYPAALDDCYAALLWLRENGPNYGMQTNQIMVGGDSAGGGLTAAVTLYARDKGEVAIAFQMPLYPMIDDTMSTESAQNNDMPVWNSHSNEIGWRLYLGDLFGNQDVPAYAAPARAKDYSGLPPTCTFVGSLEPFRDETISYVKNLRACGVPVDFEIYEGCFHGFDIVCPKSSVALQATDFLMKSFGHAVENYFAEQTDAVESSDS